MHLIAHTNQIEQCMYAFMFLSVFLLPLNSSHINVFCVYITLVTIKIILLGLTVSIVIESETDNKLIYVSP